MSPIGRDGEASWRSYAAEFARQPWRSLFIVAGAGVVLVTFAGQHDVLPALCGSWMRLVSSIGLRRAFTLLIDASGAGSLALEWFSMLVAMMPLLLAQPILHIKKSSRPCCRAGAIVSFVLGYACVWMLAGPILMMAAVLMILIAGDLAPHAAVLVALIWSASPAHQVALNRGHRVRRLAVFGWRANVDAATYGFVHGLWCSGACWAWMLMPLIFVSGHFAMMFAAGAIMFVERLAEPAFPRWRVPAAVAVVTSVSSCFRRDCLRG